MKNSLKNFLFPQKKNDDGYETNLDIKNEIKEKKVSSIKNDDYDEILNKSDTSKPTILKPELFKDVEIVAIELLKNKSVIVDLNSTNKAEARRICDFLNGVCYALNGHVKKLSTLLYMFSPTSE